MCTGHGGKSGTGWRFNLPMVALFMFMLLGSHDGLLTADDSQARIMEKVIALEETLQELMSQIKDVDRRVTALEKGLPARREGLKAPKPRKVPSAKKQKKLIDIGQGFYVTNLEYKGIVENTIFTGKLENSGAKDYQFVLIKMVVYGEKGSLLGDNVLNITDVPTGTTKPFKITIYGVNARDVVDFGIKFVKGF